MASSSRASALLLAGAALLVVLITAAAVMLVTRSKERRLADAERELTNLALAISEETGRAFQAVDLVEASIIESVDAAGARTPEAFARMMSSEQMHRALRDRISGLPQVDAITLIDANGALVNFSRYWPIPDVNVADRDYFRVLRDNSGPQTYVSAPVLNRATGTWTIYLARRIEGRGREFIGLVLGAMRLNHFEQTYAAISLGPFSLVSLLRSDGISVARYPHIEEAVGRSIPAESPAFRTMGSAYKAVTMRQVSNLDGKDRLLSARLLPGYPLVLFVGQEIDWILRGWRDMVLHVVVGTLLLDLLVALTTLFAIRYFRAQERASRVAHHAARHDIVTGLPNRMFQQEALLHRLSEPHPFALLCIDLDLFKAVNDTFGHPTGDDLLRRVTERFRACLGEDDLVARIGGDEFAILLNRTGTEHEAMAVATCILQRLSQPFDLGGAMIVIGASMGLAISPDDGRTAEELVRNADLALYRAKEDGGGRCHRFESAMAARMRLQRTLESDLRGALTRCEFHLVFQPIVELTSGRPIAFEALLRWHRNGTIISPAKFIPIAEASGLIVRIGEWVIEEACREASAWPKDYAIAVNLSPAQLASGRVVETVRRALEATSLDPRRLELEITETALLNDDEGVRSALHELRAMGVSIALDDFGVGYSSLSYVTSFPFDRIKIDQSFIQKMRVSSSSRTVVSTILQLATRLGVRTTAEGVENPDDLATLRQEGCTEGQGFYFGMPQASADIRRSFPRSAGTMTEAA